MGAFPEVNAKVIRWFLAFVAYLAFQPALAVGVYAATPASNATANGMASATIIDSVAFAHDLGTTLALVQIIAGSALLTGDAFTLRGSSDHAYSIITSGGLLAGADGSTVQLVTQATLTNAEGGTGVRVGGTVALSGHEPAGTYCGSYLTLVSYD